MAEVAAAITQPVCATMECLWDPIARRVNYARKLSKNLEVLCSTASELSSERADIDSKIERSRPEKMPTKKCEDWKSKVADMESKIEATKQEFSVGKRCLGGFCPNIFARIELGKRVVNMIREITELLEKSKDGNDFLDDSPPAKVEKKPDHDSKLTASAYKTLEFVVENLQDERTPKIGMWGMGGIGKTTVLQLLQNKQEITTMFDIVIWVTVSKSQSIRKLQEEVGKRLLIEITNEDSDDRVATKLFQKLEGKKYLLLLDDVWDVVDLRVVGFPNANQENGCKVVLTTRKLEVCRKMGVDFEKKVVVLSEEEAWEMFSANVGDVVRLNPEIEQLAESIVRECDGLPLALKVVSSALRKEENVNVWRNFLRELRSPATSYIEDLDEKVFKILKVSYDQLKDTEKKNGLLFCGLYSEDSKIKKSELIGHWRAEGILSRKLTLAQARDKGEAIMQALIYSSLLESCEEDTCVKMHDVVRDLVLSMTSPEGEESTQLVRDGTSAEQMPEDEEWRKATRISFMNYGLRNLPESPDCPELLTLLLRENYGLEVIPEDFFNNMPNLRVLDLSDNYIKSLPTSVSKLVSLRELLPREEYCCNIPIGVICRLSQIEIFKCSRNWLTEERTGILTQELSSLNLLSSLEFDFGSVGNLQHFVQNSKSWREGRLTEFCFFVGKGRSWFNFELWKYKRVLSYGELGEEEEGSVLPSAIKNVLSHSNWFSLLHHGKINTLSQVGGDNTRELTHCSVEKCGALENVVNRNGLERGAFPNLKCLALVQLSKLKSILCLEVEVPSLPPPSPPPNVDSFTKLTWLELICCPAIEYLFSSGFMIQQLSNLEFLSVRDCKGFKGMISEDENVEYGAALPKLKKLGFEDLPEFVSFFKGVPMCWQSLEGVGISGCPKLTKLPFNLNSAPNLKELGGSREWWDALKWDDNAIKSRLQQLLNVSFGKSNFFNNREVVMYSATVTKG